MNKKNLIKQGYSFEKIGKSEYIDISLPKKKKTFDEIESDFKIALEMRDYFLNSSTEKGKALSVVLPLIDQEDMTELLSELYDYRGKKKMEETVCKSLKKIGEILKK